jgi:hypothetical protein
MPTNNIKRHRTNWKYLQDWWQCWFLCYVYMSQKNNRIQNLKKENRQSKQAEETIIYIK